MKTTRLLFISLFLFIRTFCWSQGTWTQRATLPGPPRIEAGSFEINGKGYVLCGRNPTTQVYYNDVWEYDPVADSWTQKANFPAAGRREPICFTFNGQGVVAMGRDLAGAFNDLWFYNASTDSWTQKANFPAGGRRDGMGFPIGNKIYMGSGQTVSGFTVTAQADWWEYNPATDTWLQKANLPGPIRVAGQCISDGVTGYIGMGRVTTGNTNDWWAYNAATDTWTQKANFGPGNRDETSAFILNGLIYVGTGHAGANMADWWRFDPANDTWTQMASMSAGRTEGTPMVLNGKGYIATGYTTVLDAELWEYTPPVSPPALNSVNNLVAFSTVVGTASANQSFTVNGTNLTTNVSITAPAPFEISLSSGSGFGTSLSLAPVSGNISTTTVYVRYNPATAGSHSGNISISSTGVSSISIPLSGTSTVPAPALSSNDNLSLFSTIVGTPSSEQQFDVTGANLTANVVLSAPTDFEISTTSGSGFSSGIALIPVGGNIPATTIYVRYNPASAGSHAGNLTITSTGASSLSIALTGSSSAVGSPAIIVSASLSAFATIAGTPSAQQTALVSGSNLTANIDLQAPSDFEISLTSGSAFGASLSLTPSAGTVANTTIYIRYNPALAGSHNGNLTAMSSGANPLTIALSGTSTNPVTPAITLTGTPTAFGTVVGTPSAEQTLVVSAVGLTANLDIQAPTEFEISFSSGTGFSSTLVLVPVAGDVPNTNIFIRYNPAAVGTHNGNLTASSTGLTTQTALLSGTSTLSAIAEVEGNYRLVFYPNPMKEKTTIEVQCASGMDKEQTHLRIFDGNGKEVMRNFDEVKTEMYGVIGFTIERHSLQAGLYHFQISYQNKVIAKGKIAMD